MSVTDAYRGLNYLRTANDDKFGSGDGFITFNVNKPVQVLVGFDSRSEILPSWLDDWVGTGENIFSTAVPLHLYKKEFPTGIVQLGGNETALTMYTVVVKEIEALNSDNPPDMQITVSGAAASIFDLLILCVLCVSLAALRRNHVI